MNMMNTMTTALVALAFAGGLTVGVTVLTVVRVPEMNVEAAMTSALMKFDQHKRERERLETEAAQAKADEEWNRVTKGWGDNSSSGATLPWNRGGGQ